MDEQITIIGRPTYVAMFSGYQEAAPILAALRGLSYPGADISILFRPAGTEAAIDLVSGENAAGQDTDATKLLAAYGEEARSHGKTIVLLHPSAAQVDGVRGALTALGAQEYQYEPETRYTGADSEADVVRSTQANVESIEQANVRQDLDARD